MQVLDVDTHVVEPASVWDFLAESEAEFRPAILRKESGATIQAHFSGAKTPEYWVIDNTLYGKHDADAIASYSNGEYTAGAMTLDDLPARLADLDRQKVDVQVVRIRELDREISVIGQAARLKYVLADPFG